ncbi:MAG: hypothetical protein GWN99_08660 [Gemmatimonadetes bacterium]|uniref:Uncharacterized protein n=1 Tax=Candidatus Kutchimonas denitrificans TaxID=3056748 RepID=A0AAE4ZAF1_9BACT|nr:hypothetical protein [Gemmatimonadota bacterium]NIR76568.1 hypothetical protein [Candidatus Kutchimonas denitrificans]NIS01124.1 hypothetical protein [Gemmatimonadota bacterium]NIT66891.1 hypothetical protein [Gemmatimonadota bacterium]NIU54664.1 hypothetical protein [Gemmatimonadota bacterium]
MNWEAIGAVGEAAGAVGVIVSLVYLAVQVRQNTRSVRGEMYESIVTAIVDLVEPLTQDQELARIFETAVEDWDAVSFEDRSRLVYLLFSVFKLFENLHYQFRQGTLDPSLWAGWHNLILSYYAMPGVRTWWQMRRLAFSAEFRDYLESVSIDRPLPRPSEIARGMLSPLGALAS